MSDFIKIADALDKKHEGKTIKIRGWIYRKREMSGKIFLVIRDSSEIIQAVVTQDSTAWSDAQNLLVESCLELEGELHEDKRAPTGYEIKTNSVNIVGSADRFPITRDLSEEFLREVRHLWLRSRNLTATLKINSEVLKAAHDYFHSKDYTEFQSPIFTTQACEGGTTLFQVKYPEKKLYLTQSWQLHAEAAVFALEKLYTIAPMFRAEKSRTTRHLAECWLIEAEAAWTDFDATLKQEEELLCYIVQHVLKHCKKELVLLGRDTKELEQLNTPFRKVKYSEAIDILGKKWGYDLTDKDERELVEKLGNKPVFLTNFPREMKAFYMKPDPKDPKTVLGVDLLLPGVGEVSGGSERIADPKELEVSMKMFKLKPKDYGWYMDLRKFGSVPHSGYGFGLARLVMWITGNKHIMDCVAFPRTMGRMSP